MDLTITYLKKRNAQGRWCSAQVHCSCVCPPLHHSPLALSWSGQPLSLGGGDGAAGLEEEAGQEDFHADFHPSSGVPGWFRP